MPAVGSDKRDGAGGGEQTCDMSCGPLRGLRVVDVTINVLGPIATQLLGDVGADVIKVETSQGDPMRRFKPSKNPDMGALFLNTNRNKRSIVLNLKSPAPREALFRLLKEADVFVHSMRPAAAKSLGIGYDDVAAHNPRIVYASAPGYRGDGPNRERAAYDDVIQGESGIAGLVKAATGEPGYFPTLMADKFCGYVLAGAISIALLHRERTGQGQEVQVPMLETMLSFNMVEHLSRATFEPSLGSPGYERMFSPYHKPCATSDGYLCFLAVDDRQWKRLFAVLERPDLANDPRFASIGARTSNIDALYGAVASEFLKRPTAEWRTRLDAADLPNGQVNELDSLLSDPYLKKTGFFHVYEHPSEGLLRAIALPLHFSKSRCNMRLPPPRLGEHTREILASIGYSDSAIAEILAANGLSMASN